MAKQTTRKGKTGTKRSTVRTPEPQTDLSELTRRIDALERRIAILEARLPQPSLAAKIPEPISPKRGVILTQDQ